MAFGLKAFDSNNRLILHSGSRMYTLDRVIVRAVGSSGPSADPTIRITSTSPPLVFSKTDKTNYYTHGVAQQNSVCYPVPGATVVHISGNQWDVTFPAYLGPMPCRGYGAIHNDFPFNHQVQHYVFTEKAITLKGYGLVIYDGNGQGLDLAPETGPLMIKKRVLLDPNNGQYVLTDGSSKKITIGENGPLASNGERSAGSKHDWAGMVGGLGGLFSSGGFGGLFSYVWRSTVPWGTSSYITGDPATHFIIAREKDASSYKCSISTVGGQWPNNIDNNGKKASIECWLIDTYWYDKLSVPWSIYS